MKILVIRFSSIGDIVLTSPVVRCLHRQLGAEVHYLTKASFSGIMAANPHVAKVHSFKKDLAEILPDLAAEGFDAIIDLHQNLRSWRVRLALWRVRSRGFNKLNLRKWLLVNLRINRMPEVHIVDRYLAAAAFLGITDDGHGLDYFIPTQHEVNATHFTQNSDPYLALVIGAAHATKRLPDHKLIELCRAQTCPVLLLGGPEDAATGDRIATESGPHVTNLCGKLNLNQSASVARQATTVITHDTGMMHIAAALQKDIISFWGSTVPAFGMTPYYGKTQPQPTSDIREVGGLSCRPCSKIGFAKCPKGHFACMSQQNVTL